MESMQDPISLAVINDYPVVVQGVAQLLDRHHRISVVEASTLVDPSQAVDIVLFDAFASRKRDEDIARLLNDPRYGKVVIYTWHVSEPEVSDAVRLGVHGYLSKALDSAELAAALVRIHDGERVVELLDPGDDPEIADWPGRKEGLSPREAEMIALITQGITNDEIARSTFLSINSVKSYIRSAYRKIGVERRSQAVKWGAQHGMLPQASRDQDPAD